MKIRLQRTLTLIALVVGAAAAIVLLSRILLTLDELQTPEIRLAYAIGVTVILAGVGAVLYRSLRPPTAPNAVARPPRPSAEARIGDLYARHRLDAIAEPPPPLRHRPPGEPLTIALCGVARTGKTRLAAALDAALPATVKSHPLRVLETTALGTDFAGNLERLAPVQTADVAVFVADQDLRDYEFAAIKALAERGVSPIVALNKADQRDAAARAETQAAVTRRLSDLVAAADIVETTADPLPAVRLAPDAAGIPVEEEVVRPADVSALAARVLARLDPSSQR